MRTDSLGIAARGLIALKKCYKFDSRAALYIPLLESMEPKFNSHQRARVNLTSACI